MGTRLEKLYAGAELPAKTKMGVSGCPLNCAESFVRDVGLSATKKGWKVIVGGNSGNKPRIGDVIAKNLSDDEAVALVEKVFAHFRAHANPKERMPRFIERVGIEEFAKAVAGEDAP